MNYCLIWKVSSDPQGVVDLFLNYDCDMQGDALYENLVNALSGVSAHAGVHKANTSGPTKEQMMQLKHLALECLACLCRP